ncbi:phosphoethanolamine transferase [Aquabacterium sp. J223]|uniref:phosphoethanolamine transferase n=1 Tax=Aquabacterium sp. J223 TaxID=2898431 RepID=UPI0021AE21A6|nr:phosphoethanolamine--lipid A transferase [Aquabacterium sp. J223]UUX96651.1 phosphoethanolamine--lipid A transferase [Aquabacterium sp. J223]
MNASLGHWSRLPRAGASPTVAAAGVGLLVVVADNVSFWRTFLSAQSPSASAAGATIALALVLWLCATAVLCLLGVGRLAKPVWTVVLLVSAVAAHFIDTWGVLLDKSMMRNVLQTDAAEAADLLSAGLLLDVLVRGVLPAALLWRLPVQPATVVGGFRSVLGLTLVTVLVLAAALAAFYPVYASTFRNHRELRLQLVPSNLVGGLYGALKPRANQTMERIAPDAYRESSAQRPLLVVLVVGETARADNFSLGGYPRPTNAALDGKPVVYFSSVMSCGTDTATSLPCMFSDLGADRFDLQQAAQRENVLDVLQRMGVQVRWIENNSGCKGVCDRVPTGSVRGSAFCTEGDVCFDESLIEVAASQWPAPERDALVVLHQQGSHGPAYFKRYPNPGPYQPTCETNRLQECDPKSLVNTYDNSIAYTSRTLARAIDRLDGLTAERDVLLLYVSDHGESLGERGVFLHGLPRWIAPHEQLHVPLLMWMNAGAQSRLAPDSACLGKVAQSPATHDALFHTLLGTFGVRSSAYQAALDLLAAPRGEAECPAASALALPHRRP